MGIGQSSLFGLNSSPYIKTQEDESKKEEDTTSLNKTESVQAKMATTNIKGGQPFLPGPRLFKISSSEFEIPLNVLSRNQRLNTFTPIHKMFQTTDKFQLQNYLIPIQALNSNSSTTYSLPSLNAFKCAHPDVSITFFLVIPDEDELSSPFKKMRFNTTYKLNKKPTDGNKISTLAPNSRIVELISENLDPIQPSPYSAESETFKANSKIADSWTIELKSSSFSPTNKSPVNELKLDTPILEGLDQFHLNPLPSKITIPALDLKDYYSDKLFKVPSLTDIVEEIKPIKISEVANSCINQAQENYEVQEVKTTLEPKEERSRRMSFDTFPGKKSEVDSKVSGSYNESSSVIPLKEETIWPSDAGELNTFQKTKIKPAENLLSSEVKCPLHLSFHPLSLRGMDHILVKGADPHPGLVWLFSDFVNRPELKRPGAILSCHGVDLLQDMLSKSKVKLYPKRKIFKDSSYSKKNKIPNFKKNSLIQSKPSLNQPNKQKDSSLQQAPLRLRDVHFGHVGPNLYIAILAKYNKMRVPYAAAFQELVESLRKDLY